MKRTIPLIVILVVFAGCGHIARSSGVLRMGPDTFTISARHTITTTAKKVALTEAQKHCSAMDKEILVLNTEAGRVSFHVTFRCLPEGDPELIRPTYQSVPDTVIEDRRE